MMMTLALTALAMALGGACALAWGVVLRRDRPVRPLGGTLQARDGAGQPTTPADAEGVSAGLSDATHRWPGSVLTDDERNDARWDAWTRRSVDGEDVDPGEPWKPAD